MSSTRRQAQMAAFLQEELGKILETELCDPRMQLVTVTGIKVSASFQDAQVFVTLRQGSNATELLDALEVATGHIRHLLAQRLHTRYTPKLRWLRDDTEDQAHRLEEIFQQLHKKDSSTT